MNIRIALYTVLAYIRLVLVGVACGLFESAYYSANHHVSKNSNWKL